MRPHRGHAFRMSAEALPPERPIPALLEQAGLWKRRGRYGSATQLLWSKLESNALLLELCKARGDLTLEERIILERCGQQLEVARRCIDKPWGRWSFSYWKAIHEVDGLLLLVMPPHMLLPSALEIQQQFQRRVVDSVQCKLWLDADGTRGPLPHCVRMLAQLNGAGSEPAAHTSQDPAQLEHCRHVLRGALGVVNEQVDTTFWQLSINVALQVLSTLLLVGFLFVAFWGFHEDMVVSWPAHLIPHGMLMLTLAGSAGAVLSNMLSKERFVVATGATSRFFAYHLLVKPAVGGFAALTLLFLEQSNLLLAVVVRGTGQAAAAGSAATPAADNPAILHIVVSSPQAAFFAMAALSVVAGFSADKLLSSIMDSVLGKLLGQSEKVRPPASPPDSTSSSGKEVRR